MYKFVVLYYQPKDPEHFRRYYEQVHAKLGAKIPMKNPRYTFNVNGYSFDGGGDGRTRNDTKVFMYFEAEFESEEDYRAAVASPEGRAAAMDSPNFATGGMEILHFPAPE